MEKRQCHKISFQNAENDWDTALPVGNGRLGAMVFYQNHTLHISLNHYDCYYQDLPRPAGLSSTKDSLTTHSSQVFQDPARTYTTYGELCKRVNELRKNGDTTHMHYSRMLRPSQNVQRPSYKGASYPAGAELLLSLDEQLEKGQFSLTLFIEEATIQFEAENNGKTVQAKIIATREPDGILISLSQTDSKLWKSWQWLNPDSSTAACVSCFPELPSEAADLKLALSLLPKDHDAYRTVQMLLDHKEEIMKSHRNYWENFWCSQICLPDTFLEHLWYLQLYLLECSSANGSSYPEHSWGLSGLWDIRKPNMWGSMWYWDVNIQSSFWGTYTAGHPEFLKLFCDGYLSYEHDIRQYTRQVYGREGWALDYPHTLYHCIQPWCAQFLWLYYQYTGDILFLKEKAYPVFREQITFFNQLSRKDDQGIRHIDYDISPEQGPVTTDSVITISCIKKLLMIAVEAAKILHRPKTELGEWEDLLTQLPAYPKSEDHRRYKDSLLAPDTLFLRHPSVLMPLFPAEDPDTLNTAQGKFSSPKQSFTLWKETLQYAATHTETGTFGMGWLSAAAAKLGLGKTALMLLYEKGLDYVLHDNGLAYEESPRFLNYCHLTKPAHYLPVMMEAAGGILNAVNLMLLQTTSDGQIRIFPAVPEGKPEIVLNQVQYQEERAEIQCEYEDWPDISFDNFLSPGGFQVSAKQRNFQVVSLKIESTRNALLKLLLPKELSSDGQSAKIERYMHKGEVICFGEASVTEAAPALPDSAPVWKQHGEKSIIPSHKANWTRRRLFLGADHHTKYYQAIDSFTCPYLFGNELHYPQTPYIFDFGSTQEKEKNYNNTYPMQTILSGQCILYCAGPKKVGIEEYSPQKGYGFLETKNIQTQKQNGPDDLRESFLEGSEPTVFALRLPKGKYNLLIISGDKQHASYSHFCLPGHGTTADTGILLPEHYGCITLPLALMRDGEILLQISSQPGYLWKLNAVFVNKDFSF